MRDAISSFLSVMVLVASLLILGGGNVAAQPCYTCRTEKCPLDKSMPEWCGKKGTDPIQRPQKLKATPSILHGLSIVSEPAKASVRRDNENGEFLGETPLSGLSVAPGKHRFFVQLQGHESAVLDVEVRQANQRFSITLRKQGQTPQEIISPPQVQTNEQPILPGETTSIGSRPFNDVAPSLVLSEQLSNSPIQAVAAQEQKSAERLPARRKTTLIAVFSSFAVATLGAGIAFTILTHNPNSRVFRTSTGPDNALSQPCVIDGQSYECYLNLTPAYAIAYGLAAASTIGLGVTLGMK